MKNGSSRFTFYIDQVDKLLLDAAKQKNAALWLYQNNARTPIFMLEGLAKLYGGLHNHKRFGKIGDHVKLLEDGLGAIDYFDGFSKAFAQDKTLPAGLAQYAQAKSLEKAGLLNKLLRKAKWIGADANRIGKLRNKLDGADWLEEKPEMNAIEAFYRESIGKINIFAKSFRSGFTELESQVHELRRKLRWLSIYPQALQGCVQLTDSASNDANVAKYLTPEIVNSPFNKMPAAGTNTYLLTLNRDYFLALSWMIAELGKLKDQGLRFVVLNEAGSKSAPGPAAEAAILSKASDICRMFFEEKNLDKLVSGVTKAAK